LAWRQDHPRDVDRAGVVGQVPDARVGRAGYGCWRSGLWFNTLRHPTRYRTLGLSSRDCPIPVDVLYVAGQEVVSERLRQGPARLPVLDVTLVIYHEALRAHPPKPRYFQWRAAQLGEEGLKLLLPIELAVGSSRGLVWCVRLPATRRWRATVSLL